MVPPDSFQSLPSSKVLGNSVRYVTILNTWLSHSLAIHSRMFFYRDAPDVRLPQPQQSWFRLIPFRSSLTQGISYDFSSSTYLDISVQCVPFLSLKVRDNSVQPELGYPIRTPPDQSFLAAPRRLSWPGTSFFGVYCLGIHAVHEFTYILSWRNHLFF